MRRVKEIFLGIASILKYKKVFLEAISVLPDRGRIAGWL